MDGLAGRHKDADTSDEFFATRGDCSGWQTQNRNELPRAAGQNRRNHFTADDRIDRMAGDSRSPESQEKPNVNPDILFHAKIAKLLVFFATSQLRVKLTFAD